MVLQFWRGRSGPAILSSRLRTSILDISSLPGDVIDTLRVLKRGGNFAGRRVSQVRVYDPAQTETQQDAVSKYAHLDAEPGAIWFAGHVEKNGAVYLRDVRSELA